MIMGIFFSPSRNPNKSHERGINTLSVRYRIPRAMPLTVSTLKKSDWLLRTTEFATCPPGGWACTMHRRTFLWEREVSWGKENIPSIRISVMSPLRSSSRRGSSMATVTCPVSGKVPFCGYSMLFFLSIPFTKLNVNFQSHPRLSFYWIQVRLNSVK